MSRQSLTAVRSQAGFTLVELAVVMIIIGLLIGGVLKGQELINNAQVTSTVAQLKGIEAATSTFRDTYSGLPGDILTPGTRLPNCTATGGCSSPGNGNGRLETTPAAAPTGEAARYFVHLNAADLLTGIVPSTDVPGGNFPAGKISNSVIQVGYAGAAADLAGAISTVGASAGHYLVITQPAGATVGAAAAAGLRPSEALRIDSKLDDGIPTTGSVRGLGAATCGDATGYATATAASTCGLYVRIQG